VAISIRYLEFIPRDEMIDPLQKRQCFEAISAFRLKQKLLQNWIIVRVLENIQRLKE
jgi:hypothetical protein